VDERRSRRDSGFRNERAPKREVSTSNQLPPPRSTTPEIRSKRPVAVRNKVGYSRVAQRVPSCGIPPLADMREATRRSRPHTRSANCPVPGGGSGQSASPPTVRQTEATVCAYVQRQHRCRAGPDRGPSVPKKRAHDEHHSYPLPPSRPGRSVDQAIQRFAQARIDGRHLRHTISPRADPGLRSPGGLMGRAFLDGETVIQAGASIGRASCSAEVVQGGLEKELDQRSGRRRPLSADRVVDPRHFSSRERGRAARDYVSATVVPARDGRQGQGRSAEAIVFLRCALHGAPPTGYRSPIRR